MIGRMVKSLTYTQNRGYIAALAPFFAIFFCIALPLVTHAQMRTSDLALNADQTEFNNADKTITLKGNVQIVFKGNYISCDSATIFRNSYRVVAEGHVRLQTPKIYSEADRVDYNYESETGLFYKGFIQSGQVVFEGATIEKVGEKKYIAHNAQYTACTSCPPAWSFAGKKIVAEIGGYADITLPILKVANVPVFILPKILVPLKSNRQSGFLIPTLEVSGSGGPTFAMQYFRAIDPSRDFTVTLKNYQTRGWKGLFEYRYMLSKESYGNFHSGYIDDQAFKLDIHDNEESKKEKERGFLSYEHYFTLPENYIQRTKLRYISDLRYMRDFSDELPENGKSSLENLMSITKNKETTHFSAEVGYNINLLKEDPFAENNDAVHRFPDIRYSIIEQKIANTHLLFKTDIHYVNFARNTYGYDDICNPSLSNCDDGNSTADQSLAVDTKRDGSFDPNTDLLRTGQRIDIQPSLSYPFQVAQRFNVLPVISYRETQYQFNAQAPNFSPTAARRHIEADITFKTLFSKVLNPGEEGPIFKHEIEPTVEYSVRPWVRRTNHVFFGDFESEPYSQSTERVSDSDFFGINKLQFDYDDRLFNQRLMKFGVTNRLIRKRLEGTSQIYKNIASFSINQSYDFYQKKTENPQPWSSIDSVLNLWLDSVEAYAAASYFPYAHSTNSSTRVRVYDRRRNYLELAYTQAFTIEDNNYVDFDKRTEILTTGLGWAFKYVRLAGSFDYSPVTYKIQSWKYKATITPPGKCWGLQFTHWQEIGADINYKFTFSFDFGGENI